MIDLTVSFLSCVESNDLVRRAHTGKSHAFKCDFRVYKHGDDDRTALPGLGFSWRTVLIWKLPADNAD